VFILASAAAIKAHSRKITANYSLVQQYFNPALTGFEGPMLKIFSITNGPVLIRQAVPILPPVNLLDPAKSNLNSSNSD